MMVAMAPVGMLLAVSLATVHLALDWTFFAHAFKNIAALCVPSAQRSDNNEELKQAMEEARLRNAISGIRIIAGVLLVGIIVTFISAFFVRAHPCEVSPFLWGVLACYVLVLPPALGWGPVITLNRIKVVTVLVQVVLNIGTLLISAEETLFFTMAGLRVCMRVAFGLTILDCKLTVASNLVTTIVEIYKFQAAKTVFCASEAYASNVHAVCIEFGIFLAIIFVCSLAHSMFADNVAAATCQLEESRETAHRCAQGFRRTLSIFCDASVDLDEQQRITGPCPSLAGMLMAGSANFLIGRSFVEFVVEPDKERFDQFLACSMASSQQGEMALSAPSTVHLRMKGAAGLQFEADVFHVHIGGMVSEGNVEHLIGLRDQEQCEASTEEPSSTPNMTDTDGTDGSATEPSENQWTSNSQSQRNARRELSSIDDTEDDTATSLADLPFPDIQSISIVVDASHPAMPIHQASMTFGTSSAHPCLNDFLRGDSRAKLKANLMLTAVSMCCRSEVAETVVEDIDVLIAKGTSRLATARIQALPPGDQHDDTCLVSVHFVLGAAGLHGSGSREQKQEEEPASQNKRGATTSDSPTMLQSSESGAAASSIHGA
eukprot:gb/GFBE01045067.1/.p1 GENE.gb/GFBE01045067.1/~~gb/GFBE01045067.1/.p1  ORF type:complete len:603 (+),score=104.52 gb/GFBE01045067.1/:1-1809(+)